MTTLLVIGPAGSGKSTLVRSMCQHARNSRNYARVLSCNLDPGCDDSNQWDFDVRDLFTIQRIMNKYTLGPNGAIAKAYELLASSIDVLFGETEHEPSDLLIIDSPGQLEPLIFSETGNELLDRMKERFPDLIATFLLPADTVNQPSNYAFLLMMLTGLHLKIHTPIIHAISKADLLSAASSIYLDDGVLLRKAVFAGSRGEITEFAAFAIEIVEKLLPSIHVVKVSITEDKQEGLDDLLDLIDETKCSCGDLS
ncbi:MAG TPA: ATP/GTP-binding protein [Candidatus Lokiarchaeia archaeon]|nr:ATP/GTP-binding protein [Candidatus Lokiarchaeia archaeon]